jgi:hypothetical protein
MKVKQAVEAMVPRLLHTTRLSLIDNSVNWWMGSFNESRALFIRAVCRCTRFVAVKSETLVCMAVNFSGSRGQMTHDVNFLLPLVESAQCVQLVTFNTRSRRAIR